MRPVSLSLSSLPLTPHFPYYFRVDGAILAYSLLAANGIYSLLFQLLLILLLNALRNLIANIYTSPCPRPYRLSAKLSELPADEVVKSQLVFMLGICRLRRYIRIVTYKIDLKVMSLYLAYTNTKNLT